jgi:AraC-like DNA-binding protein
VREFPGPLSIKSVVEGRVRWRTGGREIAVDEGSFLILNDGEPYSIDIDSATPVETCCVFFERGFVEGIRAPALDDSPARPFEFPARLHARDEHILPRLRALHRARSPLWIEEQFTLLARDLLLLHDEVRRQVGRLPSARASTRAEIFKRLSRGREFLHAHLDRAITLREISRAACLSPYHFHRLFREAFGESPHEYLTRIRLERARHLLLRDERPVVAICEEVGFASLGSFHALFRGKFGVTPGAFRAAAK